MQPTRRIMILSASVGSGHISAAQALEQASRRFAGVEARHEDALAHSSDALRVTYDNLYSRLVRHAPWVLGWWYELQDTPFRGDRVRSRLDRINAEPLVRMIVDYNPDIVLCTHFMPAGIVSDMMAEGVFSTVLGIVTTDYDFQGMWLCRTFHQMFVALPESRAYLETLGVPGNYTSVTGIPVSARFQAPIQRQELIERFGLRGDRPLLLVSAGSAGSPLAVTMVRQLMTLKHDVEFVVVCGRNVDLRKTMERLVEPQRDRFHVLGYTTDMPALMLLADLFLGKPGGLTSAECMAAGLPMVIVDPIPGQEERNADSLLEAGAAIHCRELAILPFKVQALLDEPGRLEHMRRSTARLAHPNAAYDVVDTMLRLDLPPIVVAVHGQRGSTNARE